MAVEILELSDLDIAEIESENETVEDIDAEAIDLIFVAIDQSSSMKYPYNYTPDMLKALGDFKTSMTNSKESEHILIARANFASQIEIGGYKTIDEFDVGYDPNGCTLFYDVICMGVEKLVAYVKYLKKNGMRVKAVFAAFTDGEDQGSTNQLSDAVRAIGTINGMEFPSALIAFGQGAVDEGNRVGFKYIIDILNTPDPGSALRKAFDRLSKSIIENSKKDNADNDNFLI